MPRALPLALLCGLPGLACGDESPAERCGPARAVVKRVVDGDTVELADGQRLRYLLVDTPELTGGEVECFGLEAKELNSQLVQSQEVALTYDEQCTDRFGRLLAYVAVGGREINKLLVERGYACVLFVAPNGADRREEYEALEYEARLLGRGMWADGACESIPCGP